MSVNECEEKRKRKKMRKRRVDPREWTVTRRRVRKGREEERVKLKNRDRQHHSLVSLP